MMRQMLFLSVLFFFVSHLCACGQMGPLYLPVTEAPIDKQTLIMQ